jgi:uncharacterized protein YybS (DUF2232 family)
MNAGIAVLAIALLAVLVGSVWMRRAEWEIAGGSGAMLFGLMLAIGAVALILVIVAGTLRP